MDGPYARVASWLTVDCGFSHKNAKIALELYNRGELGNKLHQLFTAALQCKPTQQSQRDGKYWEIAVPRFYECLPQLNALNHTITTRFGGE